MMKPWLILATCSAVFVGCTSVRDQLVGTASNFESVNGLFHVHAQDGITITYSFWADKGIMAFVVQNDSDRPIYVDLFKSSLVLNGDRLKYWEDKRSTVTIGRSKHADWSPSDRYNANPYFANPFALFDLRSIGISDFSNISNTTNSERVLFIPPSSKHCIRSEHQLQVDIFTKNWRLDEVPSTYGSRKMETVKIKEFTNDTSPLVFRNFLTWSFNENFEEEHYVDDLFWVDRIVSMTDRQFRGKYEFVDGVRVYEFPFKSPKKFYIHFIE